MVRLYAPNEARFYRLRAYISKGRAVTRKYVLSDISAPGSELAKFVPYGVLAPGVEAPEWLQKEVQTFYQATKEIAQGYDLNGELKEARSKDIADRVRGLVNLRKAINADEIAPAVAEERG